MNAPCKGDNYVFQVKEKQDNILTRGRNHILDQNCWITIVDIIGGTSSKCDA